MANTLSRHALRYTVPGSRRGLIGLVMAGGRGSRMRGHAKLLAKHRGRESVLRVVDALSKSNRTDCVAAAVSEHAPRTLSLLESRGVRTVFTRGLGYPLDMAEALSALGTPAMVVPGDMALMDAGAVRAILDSADTEAGLTSVVCDASFVRELGLELGPPAPGGRVYSGISVVGAPLPDGEAPESLLVFNDMRAAFNANTLEDYALGAKIARELADNL